MVDYPELEDQLFMYDPLRDKTRFAFLTSIINTPNIADFQKRFQLKGSNDVLNINQFDQYDIKT